MPDSRLASAAVRKAVMTLPIGRDMIAAALASRETEEEISRAGRLAELDKRLLAISETRGLLSIAMAKGQMTTALRSP